MTNTDNLTRYRKAMEESQAKQEAERARRSAEIRASRLYAWIIEALCRTATNEIRIDKGTVKVGIYDAPTTISLEELEAALCDDGFKADVVHFTDCNKGTREVYVQVELPPDPTPPTPPAVEPVSKMGCGKCERLDCEAIYEWQDSNGKTQTSTSNAVPPDAVRFNAILLNCDCPAPSPQNQGVTKEQFQAAMYKERPQWEIYTATKSADEIMKAYLAARDLGLI